MLPTYLSHPYVVSGELVPILDGEQTVRHNILAFWTESRRGNPNVRAFLNFLDDIFQIPHRGILSMVMKNKGNSCENTLVLQALYN